MIEIVRATGVESYIDRFERERWHVVTRWDVVDGCRLLSSWRRRRDAREALRVEVARLTRLSKS